MSERKSKRVSESRTVMTEIEQQRYDNAPRRREVRLILSGRIKPEEATEIRSLFEGMN